MATGNTWESVWIDRLRRIARVFTDNLSFAQSGKPSRFTREPKPLRVRPSHAQDELRELKGAYGREDQQREHTGHRNRPIQQKNDERDGRRQLPCRQRYERNERDCRKE